jgi:SAM-dependent methyltransferase
MMKQENIITFSFGENWQSYQQTISEGMLQSAQNDIIAWLGENTIRGKTVLDIGCGSGIHSLSFYRLGAKKIISFDYDPKSTAATQGLWRKANSPEIWEVLQGSILDKDFINPFHSGDGFDIVYAWGVLHHTGAMWQAIENSCKLVKRGGLYWIALYVKGPNYQQDLALKRKYNAASVLGKRLMIAQHIAKLMRRRLRWRLMLGLLRRGRFREFGNRFRWNQKKERGMDTYHDIIDWLGGLPYEVASEQEVTEFLTERGFALEKIELHPEGSNNIYLFSLSNEQ